ncbi:hypothetical protein, conserved [Eimeria praecox]|uniref:Uncharacterized protein n=1 Tax=Eimeria praecox TaxID=51316 RepID=U6GAC7_9EIME|nr:hypothetical protein, conserved [Eimeria praecox]
MPGSQSHESDEERQARLSDPEIEEAEEEEEEEEEAADNDENYDYLQATRRLDADELQAEEEGERLIDENADDGFVFGMKDAEREAAAFFAAGFDPDGDDPELLGSSETVGEDMKEMKARRAAERFMRARDKAKQTGGDRRDIWQRLLG